MSYFAILFLFHCFVSSFDKMDTRILQKCRLTPLAFWFGMGLLSGIYCYIEFVLEEPFWASAWNAYMLMNLYFHIRCGGKLMRNS